MKDFFKDYIQKLAEIEEKDGLEVAKSAITDSSLSGTYTIANLQEQAFWDKVADNSVLLRAIGIRLTNRSKYSSDELTLGSAGQDILRPGVAATDPGDTGTMANSERIFTCEEVVGIAMLGDDVLEDTVEGAGLESHYLDMLARAFANELEYAILNGVKAGTTNSHRGSITGCWDGLLQQVNASGHVVNAQAYSTKTPHLPGIASYSAADDKHLALIKAIPDQYSQADMLLFTPRTSRLDAMAIQFNRAVDRGYQDTAAAGVMSQYSYLGIPWVDVPKMRTNFLVKGTGHARTTNPGSTQINGNGVSKARATTSTVDAITNFANTNKVVVGCADSGGLTFNLNAESLIVSGTPSGTTLTWTTAQVFDHADNEYVREFDTAPDYNGIAQLLAAYNNMLMLIQRNMTVEVFREPRKRATSHVFSFRGVPCVINPDACGLLRDLEPLV